MIAHKNIGETSLQHIPVTVPLSELKYDFVLLQSMYKKQKALGALKHLEIHAPIP